MSLVAAAWWAGFTAGFLIGAAVAVTFGLVAVFGIGMECFVRHYGEIGGPPWEQARR